MDTPDKLWEHAIAEHGGALERLAGGYEADPDLKKDLLQQIHIEVWRSLRGFSGQCSTRTWVYRVAHNVSASHVLKSRRISIRLVSLEALEMEPAFLDGEAEADRTHSLSKLLVLIHRLKPLDRQTFLLYLEGESAAAIAEIVGLKPANVATKIHRIRGILIRQFQEGGTCAAQRSEL